MPRQSGMKSGWVGAFGISQQPASAGIDHATISFRTEASRAMVVSRIAAPWNG